MKNSLHVLLLLLTLTNSVFGQTDKSVQSDAKDSTKIALSDIQGIWYPVDTSEAHSITFRQIGHFAVEIDGIKHGVGNYMFNMERDSISIKGMAPNWPPYDCVLRLLENNILEIEFYQFMYTGSTKIRYKRQ